MTRPFALQRRDLLKGGGALVIGLNLSTPTEAAIRGETPGPPDPKALDTWLAIHEDSTATLYIGFVELGQGTTTTLPAVAAEELDLGLDQIRLVQHDTDLTPNQGGTFSSASVFRGSPPIRAAAAEARAHLLNLASAKLGAPAASLTTARGVITAPGDPARRVTYGELIGGRLFSLEVTGKAPVKSPDAYRLLGAAPPRRDLPAKVAAEYDFIQHLSLPGMWHGRVVRPPGQRAYGAGARLLSVDEASIASVPGARVVRRRDFLGVVAEREWDAVRAARLLKAVWDQAPSLPPFAELHARMLAGPTEDKVAAESGDAATAFAAAEKDGHRIVAFEGFGPYQAHAPFAPNCALADVRQDQALVICPSQDIYVTRRGLAPLLGLKPEAIRVRFASSAGTYGHSCYDDVAQAAALMSQLSGRPVRVQFMRADEHGWDTYGPAHVGRARVSAGPDGRISAYAYEGWQHSWSLVETSDQLATGAPPTEWGINSSTQVSLKTNGGQYAIPNRRVVNHRVPGAGYLRGAWLRSPLDLSCAFVSEQAVDQLAFDLGQDPVAFRRLNIGDERWLGVLEAVEKASNWTPRPAAQTLSRARRVRGRGVGLGTHLQSWGAAVAEIEVDRATGRVRILKLCGAIDAGLVVNTGIVRSQITGQLVQLASRMLFEEVSFDEQGVTSLDWRSYPVIRFEDCPEVVPVIVQRLHEPSLGAGEETMAAGAAAVANAFFDATGVRMSRYPFTPERVKAALAGKAPV